MKPSANTTLALALLIGAATVTAEPGGGGLLRLDADGDGQVSRDEFRLPGERRGPRMFERADTDGDGAITQAELNAAVEGASGEHSERVEQHMQQEFGSMDTDGNAVVTLDEARDYAFSRLDSDGDGAVSEAEAAAMHERRQSRHGQRRDKADRG